MKESLQKQLLYAEEIVFVCSGNIIRSAFAHLYAENIGISKTIRSLGTVYKNSKIHSNTRSELAKLGVSTKLMNDFHPTHIDDFIISGCHAVFFCMTNEHLQQLENYAIKNVFLLSEILNQKEEIGDPFFLGRFQETFMNIKNCLDKLQLALHEAS